MKIKTLLAALALGLASNASAETYQIDPGHTQVRFQYSHFGFSTIVGLFTGITGEVNYDPAHPEAASVKASIPIGQVNTRVKDLDQPLASADFFDSAAFPTAQFSSSKVEPLGENKLKVTGTLRLRDIEKEVALNVTINAAKTHPMKGRPAIGFDASSALKRSDFGVDKYAPNVSDEVKLEITVEAIAPKP